MGCCVSLKNDVFLDKELIVNLAPKEIENLMGSNREYCQNTPKLKLRKASTKTIETNAEITKNNNKKERKIQNDDDINNFYNLSEKRPNSSIFRGKKNKIQKPKITNANKNLENKETLESDDTTSKEISLKKELEKASDEIKEIEKYTFFMFRIINDELETGLKDIKNAMISLYPKLKYSDELIEEIKNMELREQNQIQNKAEKINEMDENNIKEEEEIKEKEEKSNESDKEKKEN